MYYHMSQKTMIKLLFAKEFLYKITGRSVDLAANEFVSDFIHQCKQVENAQLRYIAEGLLDALLEDNDDKAHSTELKALRLELVLEEANLFKDDWLADGIITTA